MEPLGGEQGEQLEWFSDGQLSRCSSPHGQTKPSCCWVENKVSRRNPSRSVERFCKGRGRGERGVAVATDLSRSWICLLEKHPVLILKISSNGKFTAAMGLGSQALIGGTCSKSVPPALFHWKIQTLSPTVDFSQKLQQNNLGRGAGAREDLDNIGTALFTPSGQIFTFSSYFCLEIIRFVLRSVTTL